MKLRRARPGFCGWVAAAALSASAGCGNGVEAYHPTPNNDAGGTGGGAASTGGAAGSLGSGGVTVSGTGGSPSASGSGGNPSSGSGGTTMAGNGGGGAASGGVVGTGGKMGTGGAPGTGGATLTVTFPLPWMDDFEADTVGDTAKGWVTDPKDTTGKWVVAVDGNSKVLQESVSTSSTSLVVGGDSAWGDYKVEAKVKFTTVTSSSIAYLAAHLTTLKNYYFVEFKGDGSLKIRKVVTDASGSGNTTDVLSYKTKVALVAGTWYTIAVSFQGSIVTAYLNGSAVGMMTEAPLSLSNGGIAVGFKSGTGAFDDVKVTLP